MERERQQNDSLVNGYRRRPGRRPPRFGELHPDDRTSRASQPCSPTPTHTHPHTHTHDNSSRGPATTALGAGAVVPYKGQLRVVTVRIGAAAGRG